MKERLKLLLQQVGMSQAEFADYIGVGRPSITHIMSGRDKTSQTVVSKTLLKFPELNPMWLLKGEGE
ncbi:MAG: helix-turn-helix transcriptional regulator, partial [Bacteroidales bacterium]|nr:helix-turn-helix transcriptional regulator [Bacteroidales bacterium]